MSRWLRARRRALLVLWEQLRQWTSPQFVAAAASVSPCQSCNNQHYHHHHPFVVVVIFVQFNMTKCLVACRLWFCFVVFCSSTLCTRKTSTFLFFKYLCQKLTDFNNFWCVKSWENLTSIACIFAHLTCISQGKVATLYR